MEVVHDISGHSIELVSLLASGGWAWSGWHIDSTRGGERCQPAGEGEEVAARHHSHTRGEDPLQKTYRASVRKAWFSALYAPG